MAIAEGLTTTQQRMAKVFNEWAKRYSENPAAFTDVLDENGAPVEDYGECCAIYFTNLDLEMEEKGVISKADVTPPSS